MIKDNDVSYYLLQPKMAYVCRITRLPLQIIDDIRPYKFTGWPKKVSQYQMIKNRIISS